MVSEIYRDHGVALGIQVVAPSVGEGQRVSNRDKFVLHVAMARGPVPLMSA